MASHPFPAIISGSFSELAIYAAYSISNHPLMNQNFFLRNLDADNSADACQNDEKQELVQPDRLLQLLSVFHITI